jgi:UDP-glucose 4-epimerase
MTDLRGRALLTGASGFIGGRLRDTLLDAGVDVVSIRRAGSPEPKRGRSVVADYTDVAGLTRVFAEEAPQYVFHVAGATKGVTYSDFQLANVMPTRNLLEAAVAAGRPVSRFVHVSSLTAYGPSTPERPLSESDPRQPIEYYGQSKLEAEQVVESFGDRVPFTITRPSGVYGPGDADYFELFKTAAAGWNVFFGNAQRWFSAIYVDDCVRGILGAAASASTVGRGYFLCDGAPTTWGSFQQIIAEESGRKVRRLGLPEALVSIAAAGGELATKVDKKPRLFNRQKAKMGAQPAWTCTHQAAARDFGYTPQVDQREGVRRSFAWYRERGWIK